MISRESFIAIVDALDEYWNDKIEHLKALYIYESYFMCRRKGTGQEGSDS